MNRKEEYNLLLQELEYTNPAVEYTLPRAQARNRRRKLIFRPTALLICIFSAFVLLINVSVPAARACSQIPILRELTEWFHFNKSMEAAINNNYIQEMNLRQTQNGITVTIDYIIVDQKQINVFYHAAVKNHEEAAPHGLELTSAEFLLENGEKARAGTTWSNTITNLSDMDIKTITSDFYGEDAAVPSVLILQMDISRYLSSNSEASEPAASFNFTLHLNPDFYDTKGNITEINQDFEMDGQKFTLTSVEVYPTYFQFNLKSNPANTLWLKNLDVYLENENGERFNPKENGLSAIGDENSPEFLSYRTESPWFYDSKNLNMTITGARWLSKDSHEIKLNLHTGQTDRIPDFITDITISTEETENGLEKMIDLSLTPFQSTSVTPFDCYDEENREISSHLEFTRTYEGDHADHCLIYLPGDYEADTVYLRYNQDKAWIGKVSMSFNMDGHCLIPMK